MREIGVVEKLEKGKAKVKVDKKDECSKCGMCLFSAGAKSTTFTCENKLGAKTGDTVVIDLTEKGKLPGILLVFLVPLILIGISAVISLVVIKKEMWMLILSLISIAVWFFILSFIDKKFKNRTGFIPVIVEIKNKENNENE